MSSLTYVLNFFQNLDRALAFQGYSAEVASADLHGDTILFVLEVTGSVYDDEGDYATAELSIKSADSKAKAWVRDVSVDFYPYTKDELVREINAELPGKIGGLPVRPLDVARVLASQFNKLGLKPAASIEQVL